ncbi:unnamed protein product, partial [Gongylonema pulchrum]|uniref:Transmembrane protein n=1 Tax=Gongylonema pulchrum TaxID=637853 RepID=A0A183DCZ6_9BILA
ALPSAKGRIDGHGSSKCILTWRREENVEQWSDAQQPRMLLVLDFLGDTSTNEKRTLTRLIGASTASRKVTPGLECDPNKPPIEQLMLDARSTEQSRSTSKEPETPKTPKTIEQQKTNVPENVMESFGDWLSRQSKESIIGLILFALFCYFLGVINSKRRKNDE